MPETFNEAAVAAAEEAIAARVSPQCVGRSHPTEGWVSGAAGEDAGEVLPGEITDT